MTACLLYICIKAMSVSVILDTDKLFVHSHWLVPTISSPSASGYTCPESGAKADKSRRFKHI